MDDGELGSAAEAPKATRSRRGKADGDEPTHIRFIGTLGDDTESSSCVVFGKLFYRGKSVPLSNLDGTNPEKTALSPEQFAKLKANPAFELSDGTDPEPEGDAAFAEEA